MLHGVRDGRTIPATRPAHFTRERGRKLEEMEAALHNMHDCNRENRLKSAIFLPDAIDVFNTFSFTNEGDSEKIDVLMEKFEAYCIPRKNVAWERHIFNTRKQKQGEYT